MNTLSLILATLLLAVPVARADPPDVQLRKAQQDLFEAFTSGRVPKPELLDVPVLRDPNRFPAEIRYNAERLQRLISQVAGIQDGTDGSENGKGRQMLHIQEAAYQFQRLLRVPDGMPPKLVVAIYQTKIKGSAISVAAIPDPNKARMGKLMNADVFGPARDPGAGLAATERYLTDAPMRAAEFRPRPKPLDIQVVPSHWAAPADLTKTPYFDIMARYHADYTANLKKVSGLMDEYWERRSSDCEHAASPACTSNTFALGVGYARLFINAAGSKLTGASTVGGQAKELGKFALDLSPAGGIKQAYEDYEQSGLGHFGDWKNLGLAVAGLAPFARTGKQVYTGAKAVREGEAVLAEAGKVGRTAVSDALGVGFSPAKAAAAGRDAHIGVAALTAAGVEVSPEMAARIRGAEAGVSKLNSVYVDGYHAVGHQVGKGSVADLAVRTALPGLQKPAGMSSEVFNEVRAKFYLGALAHDVESVTVIEKNGRRFLKYEDPTKVNSIDIAKLGAPVETRLLADGSKVMVFPKPPDSRSNLQTTIRTLNDTEALRGANDPLVKYFALKGTASSKEEKALADKLLPELERKIRAQYGKEADAVLELAGGLTDKMAAADFFNHYVRDPQSAMPASHSLQREFQDPMVQVKGTFGFFKVLDEKLASAYSALPPAERANFMRNAVMFKLTGQNPDLLAVSAQKASKIAFHPEVEALLRAHPEWASKPYREIIAAIDAVETADLSARVAASLR